MNRAGPFLLIVLMVFSLPLSAQNQVVYLLRHAEKCDHKNDPELSKQGIDRANQIASLLSATQVQAVYSTDYQRTRQTAKPVAHRQQLSISIYAVGALQKLADQLLHNRQSAIIIGHSNTTPRVLKMLTGIEHPDLQESQYDVIFQIMRVSGSDQWLLQILKSTPLTPAVRPH